MRTHTHHKGTLVCLRFHVHFTWVPADVRVCSQGFQLAGERAGLSFFFLHRKLKFALQAAPAMSQMGALDQFPLHRIWLLESKALHVPMDRTHSENPDGDLQKSHGLCLGKPSPHPCRVEHSLLLLLHRLVPAALFAPRKRAETHVKSTCNSRLIYDAGIGLARVFRRFTLGTVHCVYINQINIHCHCPVEQLDSLC